MAVTRISGRGPAGPKGDPGPTGTVFASLLSGVVSTSNASSAPLVIGSAYLDPATISASNIAFEAILSVSGGGASTAANIVLFDMTSGSAVCTLSSTSTSGGFVQQSSIAVPASGKQYEVRLYVSDSAGSTTKAIASMARLRFY